MRKTDTQVSTGRLRRVNQRPFANPIAFGACGTSTESGMALIGVLLILSLMLMLGLAVTFSSVSDKFITSNYKNITSGFYAAEAGIGNLHRILRSEQFVTGSLPDPPKVSPGQPTLNPGDFIAAAEKMAVRTEHFPNDAAYRTKVKITDIKMPYPATDQNPAHASRKIKLVDEVNPRRGQIEPYTVSYQLESIGEGLSGLNGMVTLVEEGVINFKLLVRADGGGLRVGSFAEFALFLDKFDPYNPEGPFIYQGLGPGDRFSGRIHTNERFGFWTTADGSNPPGFNGYVTQSFKTASYYRHGAGFPPPPVDADSDVVDGVLVAPKFRSGFQRGVDPIPPTTNAFDQARAVLDGGYELSAGPPSDGQLHAALRSATDLGTSLATPKDPDGTTPTLARGVYIPTDGEAFTGSGFYIMGDAEDIQLTADPAGNRETIRITQGRQTTTIVVDLDAGTTTVDAGHGARTLRGIPLDRSIVKKGDRSAASLYVYGSVGALHGPGRDGNGMPAPAIDSNFALTVTAGGRATGDPNKPVAGGSITLTGDLTYETSVVDAAGNPINQSANNVLGIFASGGNIFIPGDGTAPDNLTVHGSMAAFELKNADGTGVLGPNGLPFGGRIRSDVLNFRGRPFRGNFTLVGGAQSTNYDNLGVYDGQFHGYLYKGVWDPRYDAHQSPPFYPGYVVESGGPTGTPVVKAQTNSPMVLSYKRIYHGSVPSPDGASR
ncbi:MAG TPA: PilX N-terminal domain-containing pilus assembly protein [Blastocatellia bacterium]|nr:PilX N-terminal domain-containing pilus assembly protein [Blastocatellia bacterium]